MIYYLLTLKDEQTSVCSPNDDGNQMLMAGSYLAVSKCVGTSWRLVIVEGDPASLGCYQSPRVWKTGNNDVRRIGWFGIQIWRLMRAISTRKAQPKQATPSAAKNGGAK